MNAERIAELLERMGAEIGGCICSTCIGRQSSWVAEHHAEWLEALEHELTAELELVGLALALESERLEELALDLEADAELTAARCSVVKAARSLMSGHQDRLSFQASQKQLLDELARLEALE